MNLAEPSYGVILPPAETDPNNGEIIRYWEKGLENIPETMITVRNIGSSKGNEP